MALSNRSNSRHYLAALAVPPFSGGSWFECDVIFSAAFPEPCFRLLRDGRYRFVVVLWLFVFSEGRMLRQAANVFADCASQLLAEDAS